MYGAEGMNATGTELLDQFGSGSGPWGRTNTNREALRFVLKLLNEPEGRMEDEVETSTRASLNRHTSWMYF